MLNPSRNRLSLVDEAVQADPEADGTERSGGLARWLEELIQEELPTGAVGDPSPTQNRSGYTRRIPFCIRLTMEQVLQVAEDAELRAQMLEWSTKRIPGSGQVRRKVSSLHDVAIYLRTIAAHLEDGWGEPRGSS